MIRHRLKNINFPATFAFLFYTRHLSVYTFWIFTSPKPCPGKPALFKGVFEYIISSSSSEFAIDRVFRVAVSHTSPYYVSRLQKVACMIHVSECCFIAAYLGYECVLGTFINSVPTRTLNDAKARIEARWYNSTCLALIDRELQSRTSKINAERV